MKNSFDNKFNEELLHIAVDERNFDEVGRFLKPGYSGELNYVGENPNVLMIKSFFSYFFFLLLKRKQNLC